MAFLLAVRSFFYLKGRKMKSEQTKRAIMRINVLTGLRIIVHFPVILWIFHRFIVSCCIPTFPSVVLEVLFYVGSEKRRSSTVSACHVLFISGKAAALRRSPSCEPKAGSCQRARLCCPIYSCAHKPTRPA